MQPPDRLPPPATTEAPISHVFFDAEGTLWEPRPGRTIHDFWEDPSRARAQAVFTLTPGIQATLDALRERGLTLVVMSKHDPDLLPGILADFGLRRFFDDVLVDDDKGPRVARWLNERNVPPARAVMVGDRAEYDIRPLADHGVVGVLLDRTYNRRAGHLRIRRVEDLLPTLAFLNALRCPEQRRLEAFVDGRENGADG